MIGVIEVVHGRYCARYKVEEGIPLHRSINMLLDRRSQGSTYCYLPLDKLGSSFGGDWSNFSRQSIEHTILNVHEFNALLVPSLCTM